MNGRSTKTISLNDPTLRKYILCQYSESENGEVKLVKVAESLTDKEAGEQACELLRNNIRAVLLTEVIFPSWS
jgi:hypothetical protein